MEGYEFHCESDEGTFPKCPVGLENTVDGEMSMRKQLKVNSNKLINSLKIPGRSRLSIPLCRMISLPQVRPLNEVEVQRLENEFINGYREGDRVLFVSPYNDLEQSQDVTEVYTNEWGIYWHEVNAAFEKELAKDDAFASLRGKMFYVWEGNHRLAAWMRHIEKFHCHDREWHYSVDCIVLDSRGNTCLLLDAMNDINW